MARKELEDPYTGFPTGDNGKSWLVDADDPFAATKGYFPDTCDSGAKMPKSYTYPRLEELKENGEEEPDDYVNPDQERELYGGSNIDPYYHSKLKAGNIEPTDVWPSRAAYLAEIERQIEIAEASANLGRAGLALNAAHAAHMAAVAAEAAACAVYEDARANYLRSLKDLEKTKHSK